MWVCSSTYEHSGTVDCRSAPGVMVYCTVTLACPEAIQHSAGPRGVVGKSKAGKQGVGSAMREYLLPGSGPRSPSIAYQPRSRSQAAVATPEIWNAGDGQDGRKMSLNNVNVNVNVKQAFVMRPLQLDRWCVTVQNDNVSRSIHS